jgi:hypothetical protein
MTVQAFPEPPTQSSFAKAVEDVVRSRTNGGIRDLRVDVADGTVVLTGRAVNYYTKQLATHAALDVVERAVDRGHTPGQPSHQLPLNNAIVVR